MYRVHLLLIELYICWLEHIVNENYISRNQNLEAWIINSDGKSLLSSLNEPLQVIQCTLDFISPDVTSIKLSNSFNAAFVLNLKFLNVEWSGTKAYLTMWFRDVWDLVTIERHKRIRPRKTTSKKLKQKNANVLNSLYEEAFTLSNSRQQ